MSNLNSDNDQLVINTLTLLSKFLDRYEGKKTLKSENKATGAYNSYQNVSLPVILKPDGVKKMLKVNIFTKTVEILNFILAFKTSFDNEISLRMRSSCF